jgi:DNA-binding CsgD family transcriptional regulator
MLRRTPRPKATAPGSPADECAAFVRFTRALSDASNLDDLERVFSAGFGRLLDVPMYGFYLLEPERLRIQHWVGVNVSDVFVARYQQAIEADPLVERLRATGQPVYNLALMSGAEWEGSAAYRLAYFTHRMRHVAVCPLAAAGHLAGALHFAASEPTRNFAPADLRLAEAIASVLGSAMARIRAERSNARELRQARAALELAGTAVVITRPQAPELSLNQAARELLDDIEDADERLHEVLGRPATAELFSRRTQVRLTGGETAVLHAHSDRLVEGGLVTVLEIQRERPGLSVHLFRALTPRESEVAALVVDGLSDREIAERLSLSYHTVGQHVKRIYRKLGVDSRVRLTRLLVGLPSSR